MPDWESLGKMEEAGGGPIGGWIGSGISSYYEGKRADDLRRRREALMARLNGLDEDPGVLKERDQLYGSMRQGIDQSAQDSSEGQAAGLARRGLGGSGQAFAGQQAITSAATNARARAYSSAFETAHEHGRQGIMDQAGLLSPLEAQNEAARARTAEAGRAATEDAGRAAGLAMGVPTGAMKAPATAGSAGGGYAVAPDINLGNAWGGGSAGGGDGGLSGATAQSNAAFQRALAAMRELKSPYGY